LWDEIKNKTRLLVDQNRKAIEVIAGALLERETLSYDDVIRLLKDRCPDFTFEGTS
jgi:ATP-dependent Zn protease